MNYSRPLLESELHRDEGVRLQAYKDSLGYWTIGVGHLLGDRLRMTEITSSECIALLQGDINDAEIRLSWVFPEWVNLDPVRQRALMNMSFNLGMKLSQFKKFLAALKAGDWVKAGDEMMDSLWATQVKDRARRLRDMIVTGREPNEDSVRS